MRIPFLNFKGLNAKTSSHLDDKMIAQIADNCNLVSGDLRAFKSPEKDEALSLTTIKTLYKYEENGNDNWFVSANDLDFVKSPVSDDAYERVYFTGESEPRFFANDNVSSPFDGSTDYYKLGIPAPTSAPTVTTTGGGATYKGYVYSYVNSYGDEGPPSAVGSDDDYDTGTVAIEDIVAAPASRAIDKIYLYRTNASGDGTAEYQFVLEATWFSASVQYEVGDFVIYATDLYKCTVQHTPAAWDAGHFTAGDDVTDANLLSVYPKTNYDPPPTDLTALISLPNGVTAGISEKAVYFSEPYRPHAYPTEYIIGFDETPIGLGVNGSTVIVLTDGLPYKLFGNHPSSMSKIKVAHYYPCTSKRGIVSAKGKTYWPTHEGLAVTSPEGTSIATENIMDKDDWAAYTPASLAGYFYQGKYFGFDSVRNSGFILDFVNNHYVTISVYAHAGFVDDSLDIVVDDVDLVDEEAPPVNMPLCVSQWEGSDTNYLTYTWRSKEFIFTHEINFAALFIALDDSFYSNVTDLLDLETENTAIFALDEIGGSYGERAYGLQDYGGDDLNTISTHNITSDVTFRIYSNDTLKVTKTISGETGDQILTLPGEYAGRRTFIELSGATPIKRVFIAPSIDDLSYD
jgi:hypothetical protein